jgi:hypothetical protein
MKKFIFILLFLFPLGELVGSQSHWNYGSGEGSKTHWNYGSGEGSKTHWNYGSGEGSNTHWNYGSGEGSKTHWNYGSGLTFPDNPMIDVCLGLRGSGDTLPSICNYITPE